MLVTSTHQVDPEMHFEVAGRKDSGRAAENLAAAEEGGKALADLHAEVDIHNPEVGTAVEAGGNHSHNLAEEA